MANVNEVERKNAIYDEIVGLSNQALGKINQNDLFKFFGEKHHDLGQEENKKLDLDLIFVVVALTNFKVISIE